LKETDRESLREVLEIGNWDYEQNGNLEL